MTERTFTAGGEFLVSGRYGWETSCAECLPILVRRSFRLRIMPMVRPFTGGPCLVREPHPEPGMQVPWDGFTCPRPLTGPCQTNECDHD